ncbi:MAG: leucine-rich repeat domain-containing protein [Lachnospiraceae bacterium]
MKKFKGIILMVIVSVMMMFISLPVSADNVSGDWEYTVSSGEATLTKYIGNSRIINIPSSVNGYPVTGIGNKIFYDTNITSLTIPASIEYIGSAAFANCKYLTNVNYNAKDCYVYYGRSMMSHHVFVNAGKFSNSLTVTFGPSVKRIPTCLFEASEDTYARVTKVVIPDNVEVIGKWAFHNCQDLSSLSLGNGILEIGEEAFADCLKLRSVTIPYKTEEIGPAAFANLKYLTQINYNAKDCNVYYSRSMMSHHAFVNAGKFTNSLVVNFGSGVKRVPKSIFEAYENSYAHITEVNLPSSVVEIGGFAFNNCRDLKKITVSSKNTKFPTGYYDAFENCSSSLIFKCYRGSTAASYASKRGFKVSYYNSATSISKATVKLSTTKYTYTGKDKKPITTVTIGKTTLKLNKDYSVSYKNNKSVGTATVSIKGLGNYTGTITKTFTIVPKGTTISKLSAISRGFTVILKKQTTQTTGYQVQYSTSSKFSSVVTKDITKNSKTSATYSKIQGNKKYYVRVRTYKSISGKRYYSSWSSVKSVITRK